MNISKFIQFLEAAGAQIMAPTNPYEAVRFKANNEIGIIYKNKDDRITSYTGEARKASKAFKNGIPYSATDPKRRVSKNQVLNTLLQRDGTECFFCGKEMEEGHETIEHLLPINKGGSNHTANLVLCHAECNALAGHLDVVKKVELRDKLRSEKSLS